MSSQPMEGSGRTAVIPTAYETASAIVGATLLARFDKSGLDYLDSSKAGAWRSFFAAVIAFPMVWLLCASGMLQLPGPLGVTQFTILTGAGYVLAWAGFAWVMWHLSRSIQRESQYFRYLCAHNWSNLLKLMLLFPLLMLGAGQMLDGPVFDLLLTALLAACFGYTWFLARETLGIPLRAALFVVSIDGLYLMWVWDLTEKVARI